MPYGTQAARRKVLYRGFTRLNEVASPENLADNELQEAYNVIYDRAGGLSKRFGVDRYNAVEYDANPIKRLIDYSRKGQHLVASGTTLRKLDGTVIKSDFANTNFDWEVFTDGKLYLVNGDNYYVYDGATIAEVTNSESDSNLAKIKKCKYIVQRGERMFAAGNPDSPNTIYFSEPNDPTYFKNISEITAVSDDDDILTGLAEFHGAMVAFKKKHVYAWFGWDPTTDVRFDKINVHTGTLSHLTIKRVYNYLFYMGSDGVYALTGLEPDYISSVSLTDETLKTRFNFPDAVLEKACAEFYDGLYLLSVSESGSNNDTVYVYDYRAKAWAVWTGWNAGVFMVANIDGKDKLLIGSDLTGLVYTYPSNSYNDDGNPIHFKITTKPFDCEHPLRRKKFTRFYLLLGEGLEYNTADVSVYCDSKIIRLYNGIQLNTFMVPGQDLFAEELPAGQPRLFFKRARMLGRSMRAQVTIENNVLEEGISVYGLGFEFWPITT